MQELFERDKKVDLKKSPKARLSRSIQNGIRATRVEFLRPDSYVLKVNDLYLRDSLGSP